jgi:hypothetical protein
LVKSGIEYAVAGFGVGLAQPFVSRLITPYIGTSPLARAGVTFGTGYGLSVLANFIPFTRKYSSAFVVAGTTIAAAQLISTYVAPYLSLGAGSAANPTTTTGLSGPRRGLRGIGIVTGTPPRVVLPPAPAAASGAGMNGIGMRPGVWGR